MLILVDLCLNKEKYCFKHLENVIKGLGIPFQVVKSPNDVYNKPTAIILSGSPMRLTRPSTPKEIKLIKLATNIHLQNPGVPILGICFGFQLLNVLYGGSVKPFGRLVCERLVDGLEYCFNDIVDRHAPGFRVQKQVVVDGRAVSCYMTDKKRNITAFLFHSEATDNDERGFVKRWIKKSMQSLPRQNI